MILKKSITIALAGLSSLFAVSQEVSSEAYLDDQGVIRWSNSHKEVSLYGANYCLPSACDYRAAGYITNDRKKVIDQDMAHFARMGFDALRLCLWGDFENTDSDGNLIENDHLDLMNYLIAKAKERGIYMLLSPIVTYSSLFPDAMAHPERVAGSLSATYKKGELGTNPDAIKAQSNYISQLLNHMNPYTKLALKDDPSILFVEMINEPTHHSADVEGSVNYINALIAAVRNTGCEKPVFHNVSQDFAIDEAMARSNIQGASFAWYPSGLNSGHELEGNYLPTVDKFSERMLSENLRGLGRIVYEFDSPDLVNGNMLPAMARSFRTVGAQWASIFSYDMLATAPYNLGWQTHYFNMVYTPGKAVGAMIAAEIMRSVPMYEDYGKYPANTSFGDFRLSYDEDLAELNRADKFYYTNDTESQPVSVSELRHIAGVGSSSVVGYEGRGIYFLDWVSDKTWRLEVYPDALPIRDPFEMPSPDKVVTRSISRAWPMRVRLPELGDTFSVIPLNDGNHHAAKADSATFTIRPGVYMLTADQQFDADTLPDRFNHLGMREFESLPDQPLPLQVISGQKTYFRANEPLVISAEIYSQTTPDSVTLFLKTANSRRFMPAKMQRTKGYTYEVSIPWRTGMLNAGPVSWCIVVHDKGQVLNYPSQIPITPRDWNFAGCETWDGQIIAAQGPVKLLEVKADFPEISATRTDERFRSPYFSMTTSPLDGDEIIHLELPYDRNFDDYTLSLFVADKLAPLGSKVSEAEKLVVAVRGVSNKQGALITLVERDGTSWNYKLPLTADWQDIAIPIEDLALANGVMLPVGYPGRWNYWLTPAAGRGGNEDKISLANVERVQLSLRPLANGQSTLDDASFIDVSKIYLTFD